MRLTGYGADAGSTDILTLDRPGPDSAAFDASPSVDVATPDRAPQDSREDSAGADGSRDAGPADIAAVDASQDTAAVDASQDTAAVDAGQDRAAGDAATEDAARPDAGPLGYPCVGGPTTFFTNMSARMVIGQPDFASREPNQGRALPDATTLWRPVGISVRQGRIAIGDNNNNRALIFEQPPEAPGAPADVVLGQPDFTSNAANNGGIGPASQAGTQGVLLGADLLFVSEWSNNRVLGWSLAVPLVSGAAADVVLGQADFFSAVAATSAPGLAAPVGLLQVGDRLVVADAGNNRVLIFDLGLPFPQDARVVVGQADFVSRSGGTGPDQMSFPLGVASDGTRLIVSQSNSNLYLVFNQIPTTSGAAADLVLGGYGFGPLEAQEPVGVFSDGQRLFLADRSNHRVLIWDRVPTEAGVAPDVLLGQETWGLHSANQGLPGPQANTLNSPHFLHYDGCRLFVADSGNNRVLVY